VLFVFLLVSCVIGCGLPRTCCRSVKSWGPLGQSWDKEPYLVLLSLLPAVSLVGQDSLYNECVLGFVFSFAAMFVC
jgi:hypothetical protein